MTLVVMAEKRRCLDEEAQTQHFMLHEMRSWPDCCGPVDLLPPALRRLGRLPISSHYESVNLRAYMSHVPSLTIHKQISESPERERETDKERARERQREQR